MSVYDALNKKGEGLLHACIFQYFDTLIFLFDSYFGFQDANLRIMFCTTFFEIVGWQAIGFSKLECNNYSAEWLYYYLKKTQAETRRFERRAFVKSQQPSSRVSSHLLTLDDRPSLETSSFCLFNITTQHSNFTLVLPTLVQTVLVCNNYRPVSVLSVVSKVFEKLISKQLYIYLETNGILTRQQAGFRKNNSTETSLLSVTNNWLLNMDKGYLNGVIFLDLKKAFDCVDDTILTAKFIPTLRYCYQMAWGCEQLLGSAYITTPLLFHRPQNKDQKLHL